ncbi:alpha/beta hydrolase-fold protein [Virgisporangium ochraceum]|uniref:Acyl-CoA:diacylglycerol acyltransferase n=1 Tax=Virgisporangium ochraceum TaxID=65505 RepID=A0A8J3ZN90_9ACTN|nr:alpha/beta hydrolase-fold protein [Virgisporangium ochraceum]GIJ66929.1 esterase [Virgisporangium ochraceum]
MGKPRVSRRAVLAGGAGVAAAAGVWLLPTARDLLPDELTGGPEPVVPDAPPGDERLERRGSVARSREVDLYTAVPEGHGDGWGLPVCVVLHGGSKSPRDFPGLGLGRFLTAAVDRGAAPFVLVGASGDRLRWRPSTGDDPQRMVHEEIPAWCAERGFDTRRMAVWGWSMGGYGALRIAQTFPGLVRSVAAFSPAVQRGDDVFDGVARLRGIPVGLWCGRDDDFYDDVRALHRALPAGPVAGGYTDGRHNFGYWSRVIPAAFAFVASTLR